MECDLSELCNPLTYMLSSWCVVCVKEVMGFEYISESSFVWTQHSLVALWEKVLFFSLEIY